MTTSTLVLRPLKASPQPSRSACVEIPALIHLACRCNDAHGLGALHDLHPGRPSLACDLLEPLRCQVDRWVLAVCTSGQLTPEHFLPLDPTRGVRLQPAAFSSMLADWERHWQAYQLERSLQLWLQRWETFLQTSAPAQNVPPNSCHSPKNEQPPHKMLDIDAQKTYSEALARDEQQGLHLMEDG